MKKLLLFLTTSVTLFAQTAIRPSDVRPDSTTVTQIYAAMPIAGSIKFGVLNIDATLVVDTATTPWTLKVAPSAQTTINFVINDVPNGTINGTNAIFSLNNIPIVGSSAIYRNGLRLKPAFDYTISGNTITFLMGAIPQLGDTLLADYRR